MTEHLPWRVVPAVAPNDHVFASFDNEKAAHDAALQMNWNPDRESVCVLHVPPKETP